MVRTPNFHDKGPGVQSPVGKLRSDKPHSMAPPKRKHNPKSQNLVKRIFKDGHSKHERGRNQNCCVSVNPTTLFYGGFPSISLVASSNSEFLSPPPPTFNWCQVLQMPSPHMSCNITTFPSPQSQS